MGFNQNTIILLRAQRVAQLEWHTAVAMYDTQEIDSEGAGAIEAAWSKAYRLGQKALAAVQAEEAQHPGMFT